ncbi:S-layer homology domain-containing protein [Paenibacillus sp. P96]|uniref:S-layer homology domain-containing protein n=1 Tax=Paenibacillus zeirhizosphaerae TaxID=2987519 RepID=A0ABT9FNV7_9BACL|nr:S-layer homology domain-containing protein [Paenibacillus sp. P96]MDP4096411.1 S-layer homology domain-containing protein [Paenibacillus sp. P96]
MESVYGKMTINGSFTQSANGTLELNLTGAGDVLEIKGAVQADGKLRVKFTDNYVPGTGNITLITHGAKQRSGEFANVEIDGFPGKYRANVIYQDDRIVLYISRKSSNDDSNSGGSDSGNSNSAAGLVQGVPATSFAPNRKTTRAQAVTLIVRALESDSTIKEIIEGL